MGSLRVCVELYAAVRVSNEYALAERVSAYLAMIVVCVYAGVARMFHLCTYEGYICTQVFMSTW